MMPIYLQSPSVSGFLAFQYPDGVLKWTGGTIRPQGNAGSLQLLAVADSRLVIEVRRGECSVTHRKMGTIHTTPRIDYWQKIDEMSSRGR
jgi:hypothetical protein